jgi:hypothetical protein
MFDKRERGLGRFFTGFARNRYRNATAARGLDGEFILGMALAVLVVVFLWWTPLLFPFRIFTTAAHEVSHALASIIMGGGAGDIKLFWNGGGVTQVGITGTLGAIVVYSAGYLGSVIFGGLLLLQSKKAATRRRVLWLITAGLLLVTVFFIRDLSSLAMVAIVAGLAGLAAYRAPNIIVTFVINVLALLSCLYSLMDLFWLIISSTNPFHQGFNDAKGLATYTGIPEIIWAVVWGLVGAFMMFMFLKWAIRKAEPAKGPATGPLSGPKATTFDRYDEYLSKK